MKSNYCNWGPVTGTWSAIDGGKTMLITCGSPLAQYYFTSLRNISGSTSAGSFTA